MPTTYNDTSSNISSFLRINFHIRNVKANYTVDPAFKAVKVKNDTFTIVLENAKDFLTMELNADYALEIFGLELLKGKTRVTLKVINSNLSQKFTQDHEIKTELGIEEKNVNVAAKITLGNDIFDIAIRNIEEQTKKEYFKELKDNFANEVNKHTKFLYNWLTIKPYNRTNSPLIIHNDLSSISSYESNTDFCFETKIKIINEINNETLKSKTVFKFEGLEKFNKAGRACITHSALLAISEVMSKADEFSFTVEPKDLRLDEQLMDLLPIVPKVQELFNMAEKMKIKCKTNNQIAITLVKTAGKTHIQIPLTCTFGGMCTKPTECEVLTLNVITRTTYNIVGDFNNGINFNLTEPKLYSFNYQGIVGPVSDFMLLQSIALQIVNLLEGKTLLKENLKLSMDLHEKRTGSFTSSDQQACFIYQ